MQEIVVPLRNFQGFGALGGQGVKEGGEELRQEGSRS